MDAEITTLADLLSTVSDINNAIKGVDESRSRNSVLGKSEGVSWKADTAIKDSVQRIIAAGNAISDACTKIVVFLPTKPKPNELSSLLQETLGYIQALFCEFMNLSQTGIGKSCYKSISESVKLMYYHVANLLELFSTTEIEGYQSAVGLVWKSAKELANIPISNKAACRRAVMQECTAIKDTEREFEGYLVSAAAALASAGNAGGNNDDTQEENEDEEDEEEDEREYTADEVPLVQQTTALISLSFRVVKSSLAAMTVAADSFPVAEQSHSSSSSVSPILYVSGAPLCWENVMSWVSEVVLSAQRVQSGVTDVGCELYPPVEAETIEGPKIQLIESLRHMLTLLDAALAVPAAASLVDEIRQCRESVEQM